MILEILLNFTELTKREKNLHFSICDQYNDVLLLLWKISILTCKKQNKNRSGGLNLCKQSSRKMPFEVGGSDDRLNTQIFAAQKSLPENDFSIFLSFIYSSYSQ